MRAKTDEQTTRILTVDDSASMRALTNCAADQPGLRRGAGRGWRVALEWLAMNEVDVVITDINMPASTVSA
jgi:two-component system chemotaxis response regulator CheY